VAVTLLPELLAYMRINNYGEIFWSWSSSLRVYVFMNTVLNFLFPNISGKYFIWTSNDSLKKKWVYCLSLCRSV
jgi:hypothetical protein